VRRVGLIFLAIGLGGFLVASQLHAHYKDAWETARWMLMGVAVIGVVFTILPGKPEPS
jgi:ethanolamine transporter EutH